MEKNLRRVTVADTGEATASNGYANSGVHIGDVNLLTGTPVTTRYRQQVQRIAPTILLEREGELAELARFCLSPETAGTYAWWRAKAWSGKSALMSWFVLHPPENVRIVSFFITARMASQNDRAAFIDNLLEQLLALLGQQLPAFLTESTREAHMLGLLADAADACQARGEDFVLLVDGLDEDRGVNDGPTFHSIAALLPVVLHAGTRVIVSGRPNPPIPADVPPNHPLRDAAIVRLLRPSRRAQAIREEMERELKRLLRGTTLETDLLGIVAAAGGGLSAADLAELTDSSSWQVSDHLRTVAGRSFSTRNSNVLPEEVEVYLLGHEELQNAAIDMLGAKRLAEYRKRLNGWADRYRNDDWPEDTPEYLLRGYFSLLHAINDTDRMLQCATDMRRHDRMLDIIGGDTAALGEIAMTQEAFAGSSSHDLLSLSRLAVHRALLVERNEFIPANLPAVWARLGRTPRAEALARSISDPFRRLQALVAILRVEAIRGNVSRATVFSDEAQTAISDILEPHRQAHAMALLARALVDVGEVEAALTLADKSEELIESSKDPIRRAQVRVTIVRTLAAVGRHQRALRLARNIDRWSERAQALRGVAAEVAASGDIIEAATIARSITFRAERAHSLADVAKVAFRIGKSDEAYSLVRQSEKVAASIRNPALQAWALIGLAETLIAMNERVKAHAIVAKAGYAARSVTKSSGRDDTQIVVARATVMLGDRQRAVGIVRSIKYAPRMVKALATVATESAAIGDVEWAQELAYEAETLARSLYAPDRQAKALGALLRTVITSGDLEKAKQIAGAIIDPTRKDRAFTTVIEAQANSGYLDAAGESIASISEPEQRIKAYRILIKAYAKAGRTADARLVAEAIPDSRIRQSALDIVDRQEVLERRARAQNENNSDGVDGPGRLPENESTPAQLTVDDDNESDRVDDAVQIPERATNSLSQSIDTTNSATGASRNVGQATPKLGNEPFRQYQESLAMARIYFDSKDKDCVVTVIGSISNESLRAKAFLLMAQAAIGAKENKWAYELVGNARRLYDSTGRKVSWYQQAADIAKVLTLLGYHADVREVLHSIDKSSRRSQVHVKLATMFADFGDFEYAQRVVDRIPSVPRRSKALVAVIRVALRLKQYDEAEAIAQRVEDADAQSHALALVAMELGKYHELARAEILTQAIVEPEIQGEVYASLAADAPREQARRLLALSLKLSHWTTCLGVLVRFEPKIVQVIADEYFKSNDSMS